MRTQDRHRCLCCGFRSLPSLVAATCSICWWEADGLDVPDDQVRDAPNSGYTLRQARKNFEAHGHMYDEGKATPYLRAGSTGRDRLIGYVNAVRSGQAEENQATLEHLIAQERRYWPWAHRREEEPGEDTVLKALLG